MSDFDSRIVCLLTPSIRMLGARRSLLELTLNLGPHWRPFVICSGKGGLQEILAQRKIDHAIVPHYAWRKGRYFFHRYWQVWQMVQVLERIQPALLHCNEFHIVPQAIAARNWFERRTGRRIPVTAHVRLGIEKRQLTTYRLEETGGIVAVSNAVAGLFDCRPALREKVRVIYNGVDLSRFQTSGAKLDTLRLNARRKLLLDENAFIAGVAGLLSPRKRQNIVIEALGRLRAEAPNLRLILAGEAFGSTHSFASTLRRLAQDAGLEDRVRFLGFCQNMEEVYAAMNVNILISAEEGFGRSILESAAMGVPSIGSRIGGIPELIAENQTGWLINLDDVEGLASILRQASQSPELCAQMGERARKNTLEHFTIDAHALSMQRFWSGALDLGSGASC